METRAATARKSFMTLTFGDKEQRLSLAWRSYFISKDGSDVLQSLILSEDNKCQKLRCQEHHPCVHF